MSRQVLVFWLALPFLMISSAASSEPELPDPAQRLDVAAVMQGMHDKQSIGRFVGGSQARCMTISSSAELCEWNISNRQPVWKPLADAIHTTDRVALVCELPTDGAPATIDSCSAHPQRSNRKEFPGGARRGRKGQRGLRDMKRFRSEYQQIAQTWLDAAPTATGTSRLMGAIPTHCEEISDVSMRCVWKANSRTYGHGTAAALIQANPRNKITLSCVFSQSGGERSEDCVARIGG